MLSYFSKLVAEAMLTSLLLNSDQAHIDLLAGLVQANLDALTHTLAHR